MRAAAGGRERPQRRWATSVPDVSSLGGTSPREIYGSGGGLLMAPLRATLVWQHVWHMLGRLGLRVNPYV